MIRLANSEEALEILNQPLNIKGIGKSSDSLKAQPWLCIQENSKLVFFFFEVHKYMYEVHICVDENSRKHSRKLSKEVIDWLFEKGAKRIFTNATTKKIGNMALKIGMNFMGEIDNKFYYEVSKWAWEH